MNCFVACISGLLMALPLVVFSQVRTSDKAPYVIDIVGNLKNHRVFKLSEIATDVSYVRLETRQDVLIGFGSIKPAGKYFIVGTYKKPIMLFSKEGKFIRTIGFIGKGPGEYKAPYLNQVDSVKQELFVLSNGNDRIYRYSFSGNLMQDIRLPQLCTDFYRFANGNLLLATPDNYKPDGFYPFILLDPTGKLIKEIKSIEVPAGKTIAYGVRPNLESGSNGWVIVTNFGRDVLWQISPTGDIKAYATFLLGKLKAPDEYYYDSAKWSQKPFGFFALGFGCQEAGPFIRVSYAYERQTFTSYLDPQTKKLFLRDSTEAGEYGFHNDLDGGPTFGGTQFFKEGNYLYTFLIAVDIKQNRKYYEKRESLYPEKKKALLEMIDSLDEGDNPVIMIVKLKPGRVQK
ncbi:MAG: 6-bladed beta-propeller [Bacteroidia bacterium]|nr:6-bladed beta-propeller [Bacteroidia bacterium]